jgi:hypothetical protein
LNPNLIPPDECANCGAPVPRHAKACPACGADERTGWRETSIYDGLDLPGDDETEKRGPKAVNGLAWYWWIAVVLALLLGLAALVR